MKRDLDRLADGVFDVLVIGGGITGAGVALDCASRGLRVALVDKGDLAAGTSSISSKLIHGGLRYLEHGDFRLVYEALHERRRLLVNAPHLVQPLRFLLPFHRGARVPPWKWRLGLTLYDLLAGRGNLRRSRALPLTRIRRDFPQLRSADLTGGAEYHDAQMDDARLCVEVALTAASHGAVAANYCEVVGFDRPGGTLAAARVRDTLAGRELIVRARVFVNATGPWVDRLLRLAGDNEPPRLRPTRGIHLVAPDRGLPAALLLLHPRDGRVFFLIPWLGKTLIGTTDVDDEADPDRVQPSEAEVDYLLEGFAAYLEPPLRREEVLNVFAGLRPLIRQAAGDPSATSREHAIFWSTSGLLTVAGGKYTTYRSMAEAVADAALQRLGRRRRCGTARLPLTGTPEQPWSNFRAAALDRLLQAGLSERTARHLVQRYGRHCETVLEYGRREPSLLQPIHPDEPDLKAELVYQQEHELAVRPEDSLLRRTRLGLFHPCLLASTWQAILR